MAAASQALALEGERPLAELEAGMERVVKDPSKPDLVKNMWKTDFSYPSVDSLGQYVTTWSRDCETPSWNRYNINRAGGMAGYVDSVTPSKMVD